MAYNFTKTCEFLLLDSPIPRYRKDKYNYPAINHVFAYNYAKFVDSMLNFSDPDKEAKPLALGYHKLVSHTLKHILHKYKRFQNKPQQYKVWAVCDYYTREGRFY